MVRLVKPSIAWRLLAVQGFWLLLALPVPVLSQTSAQPQAPANPAAPASPASPAQWPLLNKVLPPVKPNLMVTLDDSSSMLLRHLPDTDTDFSVGAFRVRSPVTSATGAVKFAHKDTGIFTIAAEAGSLDWPQRFMRSPDTNPIYYNPEIRYRPWLQADGSRFPNASISAALLDPMAPAGKTVNLRDTVPDADARWCTGTPMVCSFTTTRRSYVPGLYYRLKRQNGQVLDPSDSRNFEEFDTNNSTSVARGPGRSDCAVDPCSQAEEQQNFANWFVYYRSRLLLAKAVLGEVMAQLPNRVRVGYGRLGQPRTDVDGLGKFGMIASGVRDFDLARRQQYLTWLYGLNAPSATPLREAVQEVGKYFSQADSRGPWGETPGTDSTAEQLGCRRAYHLIITDGMWSEPVDLSAVPPDQRDPFVVLDSVGNVDGDAPAVTPPAGSWHYTPAPPYSDGWVDQLADYAMYYWARDLRPDLPDRVKPIPGNEARWQSLSHFIVGLGVIGTLDPSADLPALQAGTKAWSENKIDDLWHAALNSHGQYFSASNPTSLQQALRQTLASMAPNGNVQGGVAAATADANDFVKYLPTYRPSDWSGDLLAVPLDRNGITGAPKWRAEAALPPWDKRRLYIWDQGRSPAGAVPFEWTQLSAPLQTAMGPQANATLVDYIRGSRALEEDGGWRVRGGLLGDFINSTPLVAGASEDASLRRLPVLGNEYGVYLRDIKASRPRVVYLGGNDGMLHAFRDAPGTDGTPAGTEIFGYLPRAVAGQLEALRDLNYNEGPERHRYFVDGPLREVDVHVSPPGGGPAIWRNYLLGSTGAGPSAVFAIDITDPLSLGAASPRWDLSGATETQLGHVTAPLAAGMLPNGKWVALFGNGYGSRADHATLFVVELEGGVVHTLDLPDEGASHGLGGVALVTDSQGRVTSIYAGDLSGRLWRLDFDPQAVSHFVVGLSGKPLFKTADGQPIIQAPVVETKGTSQWIMVGTGRLITDADVADSTVQAVYVVEDKPDESLALPLDPSQLAERKLAKYEAPNGSGGNTLFTVSGDAIDTQAQRGWRLALEGNGVPAGLRMLQPIQSVTQQSDLVLIAAEAPSHTTDNCLETATGSGINLLLPLESGLPPKRPLLDTNSDGVINSSDVAQVVGYATQSDGADAVLTLPSVAASPRKVDPDAGAAPGAGAAPSWTCGGQVQLASVSGSVGACVNENQTLRDRVWRRILQPPF